MSSMKIISILDHDVRVLEQRVTAEREQHIREMVDDFEIALQRIRNRLQDLTLRVIILEGGQP